MIRTNKRYISLLLAGLIVGLGIGYGIGYGVLPKRPNILTEKLVWQIIREHQYARFQVKPETIMHRSLQLLHDKVWVVEYGCEARFLPASSDPHSLYCGIFAFGPWIIRVVIDAQTGAFLDHYFERVVHTVEPLGDGTGVSAGSLETTSLPHEVNLYISAVPDNLSIKGTVFHYAVILRNPNDFPVPTYIPDFTVTLGMGPKNLNTDVYKLQIAFNMICPMTLAPHEETTIYDDVIALTENAEKGSYWLQAAAEGFRTEPNLITLEA